MSSFMNKRSPYYVLISLIFCSAFSTMAQNDRKPYVDSVLNSFKQLKGEKRIRHIADFIRNANFHKTRHEQFKPLIEEAFYWENKHRDPKLLNTIRLGQVNLLIAERNSSEAARHLREILRSGEPLSRKDSLSTYRFLKDIYMGVEAYPEALDAAISMERILLHTPPHDPDYEEHQEEQFGMKALILFQTKHYEEATKAYHDCLSFLKNKQGRRNLHARAGAWNNLGLCYLHRNKADSAIYSFQRSLSVWKEYLTTDKWISRGDSAFIDLLYGNIGSAYNQKRAYEKALPLLKRDLETSINTENPDATVNCYHELSTTFCGLKRYEDAMALLDSASLILAEHNSPKGLRKNLNLRVEALEGLGRNFEALQLFKKLVAFNDSMALIKNEARASVMQVIYEVEEKNHEINTERIRAAEAESEVERQRAFKQSLFIGAGLMLVIVVILFYNIRQRRRRTNLLKEKNEKIEVQKSTIEQALEEKDTLLKEIHHRVKNNLQLISGILELQAVKFDDENIKVVMEEGQSRVRSMALIHEQLYQSEDLGKINFEEYLIKLVNDVVLAFNNENLKVEKEINVNQLSFDVNVAVLLGLIVNELVTNTMKHGFAGRSEGKISISIEEQENGFFVLTIQDNGVGLPEGFRPENVNSLGLRLVKGLSRQLGGDYSFSNGGGTCFKITFKNTETN